MKFLVLLVCALGSQALPIKEEMPNLEYGNLFQGDIELVDGEKSLPSSMNAMWNLNRRWTSRTIPYTLSSAYDPSQVGLIQEGIRDLVDSTKVNGQTCVDIVPRSSQSNYVHVEKYSGCSSYIGMIGGSQRISLVDGCLPAHGTIMHEFLHAFGFYHEHTRGDRDTYVVIDFDNIQENAKGNFEKLEEGVSVDHMDTGYDYTSVMHYGKTAFAIDSSKNTITPTPDPNVSIGQRTRMSDLDIERVQIFYCCVRPIDSKYHKHVVLARDYCDGFP